MKSIVIYASHFGNTKRIAEAIVDGLRAHGEVELFSVEEAPTTFPTRPDLVVIGGPTEALRMTPPMKAYLDRVELDALRGVAAAAFDTRIHMPRWLLGSAAVGIKRRLYAVEANVIAPEESFFVAGSPAELLPGELERARAWGVLLAEHMAAAQPALAGSER
jgi:hypothetical protein